MQSMTVRDCVQGRAFPLSVFGLLQHETKLSVVNFTVRKSASFSDPLPNKAELLFLTGIRYLQPLPCLDQLNAMSTQFASRLS